MVRFLNFLKYWVDDYSPYLLHGNETVWNLSNLIQGINYRIFRQEFQFAQISGKMNKIKAKKFKGSPAPKLFQSFGPLSQYEKDQVGIWEWGSGENLRKYIIKI